MAKKSKNIDNEFEDINDSKEDLQIDQVPKTYVLINKYWDTIEKNLPKRCSQLIRFIGNYRNRFIDKLVTPYPVDYPPWLNACKQIPYTATGIDPDDFMEDVMTIRGLNNYEDPYLKDKAPYILLNMIARWMMMHDYDKELKMLEHFIGYGHYWAVFTTIFKVYKPNPDVMRYTINEMSHKSRLKALGSVDLWLQDGVANTFETYKDRLMRGSDWELHYINEKIRGKFKSAMKTIYRAQEKNEKENKHVFISSSEVGEVKIENTYGLTEILSLADKYTTKFFANPINETALKDALIPGGITEKDLRNVILQIADNKENIQDVSKLYQSLFQLFLANSKYDVEDVGSLRFYHEMQKLYKPGNSTDPNKNFIKEILDRWLAMGSKTFRATNRTATITTFRKSIYEYFILKIMQDK